MEQQKSPFLEQKPAKRHKAVIISAVVAVSIFVLAGIFLVVLNYQKKVQKIAVQPSVELNAQQQNAPVVAQNSVPTAKNNSDGMVVWHSSPKLIPTPQIYLNNSYFSAKAWEIGKIVSGKNLGDVIILMAFYPDGPGGITIARFIKSPDAPKMDLLDQYSNGISLSEGAGDINAEVLNDFPAYGVTINSLEYPGVLYTPNGEKMIKMDDFAVDNVDEKFENIFFRTDLLKKAFTDPVYDDFYTTDRTKINETNAHSIYAKNGFFVKAPDGTFKVFSLAVDFMGAGDIPNVAWNDGKKNTSKFSFQGSTSCGAGTYADVVDGDVTMDDLSPAGKTNAGETIYEYKDKNNQYLKDFYQEDVDFMKNSPEIVEGKKFTKGMTYEQFAASHTVFFWKDTFERMIRFINEDYFIDPGGCGKPVVYLYPEKTQNISVKVAPSGGFTKTEPDYGNGWNVIADPMSRIKNIADGKIYPYLFWEGKSKTVYQMSNFGFVAARDELGSLFDDKLAKLGLISKEVFDFKEYWLPKMLAENKPYYFVTFVSQNMIEKIAPLEINPKPDTTIRVLMDYKGLDEKIDAPGYDIKTPERKGFTAVEWGGMLK
jgi:hypothetical protein